MSKSKLLERVLKTSTNKMATTISQSKLFKDKDVIRTSIPILNVALSGDMLGGVSSGITTIAGPSKHFKTNIALKLVAAYLKKYPEAICIFFDLEFGVTPEYLTSMGVDPERVVIIPCMNIEELKFYMFEQLEAMEPGDKICFFVDSVGNAASKKEIDDARDQSSKADMSRAKSIKSLFRIITPYFRTRNIPCYVINHTIETIEMFSKTVMTGGTGIQYASDTAIIIGRRQIGSSKDLEGYEFVLGIDKSRYVPEKSKFYLSVKFDGGIDQFSGLYELAEEFGFVVKPSNGWYSRLFLDVETGVMEQEEKKWRKADMSSAEFWGPLITHKPFNEAIKAKYRLGAIINDEVVESEVDAMFKAAESGKEYQLSDLKNMSLDELAALDIDDED